MTRWFGGLAALLLVVGVGQGRAATILDSAANPGFGGGLIVGDYNWPFHRFEITVPTTLDTVGGYFENFQSGSLTVFAAIVQLTGPNDNPDSLDLTTPDLLGTTLMNIGTTEGLYETAFSLSLNPGWYALEFGTGAFGASSVPSLLDFGMSEHLIDLDPTQLVVVALQPGHPTLSPGFSAQAPAIRFTVKGTAVPEPSTLAIWSLLGALGITVGWWRKRRDRP